MAFLLSDLTPISKDIEGVSHTLMLLGTLINQKAAGSGLAVTAKPTDAGGVLRRNSASLMLPNQRVQDKAIEFAVKKLGFNFKKNYNYELEISCSKEMLLYPVGDQHDIVFAKQFNALYQHALVADSKSDKRSLRHRSNPLPGESGMGSLKAPAPDKRDRSSSDPASKPKAKALTPEQRSSRKLDKERKSRQEDLESDALAGSSAKNFLKQYQACKEKDREFDKEQVGLLKTLEQMKLQEKEKAKQAALTEDGRPVAKDTEINEGMIQLFF